MKRIRAAHTNRYTDFSSRFSEGLGDISLCLSFRFLNFLLTLIDLRTCMHMISFSSVYCHCVYKIFKIGKIQKHFALSHFFYFRECITVPPRCKVSISAHQFRCIFCSYENHLVPFRWAFLCQLDLCSVIACFSWSRTG